MCLPREAESAGARLIIFLISGDAKKEEPKWVHLSSLHYCNGKTKIAKAGISVNRREHFKVRRSSDRRGRSAPVARQFAGMETRLRKLGFGTYQEYLASPIWAKKKAQFMAYSAAAKRMGCAACGTTREIHVHHIRYHRLGCEWLSDLVLLCGQHHERVHRTVNRQVQLGTFTGLEDATIAVIRGAQRIAAG